MLLKQHCARAKSPKEERTLSAFSQTLCGRGEDRFHFGVQRDGIDRGVLHITAALFSWCPRHLISISFLSSPARGLTLYIRWKASLRMIF